MSNQVEQEENIRPTNVEFVSYLMNESTHGALVQPFIIEAIRYYSELVSKQPVPEEKPGAIINPVAWHNIATEVHAKIVANYEG